MTNLITFDGFMACGKKTFIQMICEHLAIPDSHHNFYNKMLNVVDSADILMPSFTTNILWWLATVNYSQRFDWKNKDVVLIKNYWRFLIDPYYGPFDEKLIEGCEAFIQRDGGQLPTCSFYISITIEESRRCWMKRDGIVKDDVKIEGIAGHNERAENVYSVLDRRYPFFHIIDGMQSKEQVFEDIVHIAQRALI